MGNKIWIKTICFWMLGLTTALLFSAEPNGLPRRRVTAAVIDCHGMIDEGLYQSIVRRTQQAIDAGIDYIFYDIQTYGGRIDSADQISKYLIHEVSPKAHTVAYISKEAISAGAIVSVSCKDIIMRTSTTIGCSAPMMLGGTLEGTEREKVESFVRAIFSRAAQANGYPELLLKAMVSQQIEVWMVKNLQTSKMEFFEPETMPTDETVYDLKNKKLIVKDDEILTLTDTQALEYGIARAVVADFNGALAFLAQRDSVVFDEHILRLHMLWSEQLVRWLTSPAVVSVLVLGILLGIYVELNTPGLGLPSILALTCLIILVVSRYLTGLANWIEIAVLGLGVILLLVELFLIPGFGITGILGIILIIAGFLGFFIRSAPNEAPWPKDPAAWREFREGMLGVSIGFVAFLFIAFLLSRYMHKIPFLKRFVLTQTVGSGDGAQTTASPTSAPAIETFGIKEVYEGQLGTAITPLHPAGKAKFADHIVDVIADGEFIPKGKAIQICQISGNRIYVRVAQTQGQG